MPESEDLNEKIESHTIFYLESKNQNASREKMGHEIEIARNKASYKIIDTFRQVLCCALHFGDGYKLSHAERRIIACRKRSLDIPVAGRCILSRSKSMKIQEFAQVTGLSTKTIRYYESIGILSSPNRMPNGYRDYNQQDVERARFVAGIRSLDLGLDEIKELLAMRDRREAPC